MSGYGSCLNLKVETNQYFEDDDQWVSEERPQLDYGVESSVHYRQQMTTTVEDNDNLISNISCDTIEIRMCKIIFG